MSMQTTCLFLGEYTQSRLCDYGIRCTQRPPQQLHFNSDLNFCILSLVANRSIHSLSLSLYIKES